MKWFVELIEKQLKVDEATARKVMDAILDGFDGHFSELTARQCTALIKEYSYVVNAQDETDAEYVEVDRQHEATLKGARHAADFSFKR